MPSLSLTSGTIGVADLVEELTQAWELVGTSSAAEDELPSRAIRAASIAGSVRVALDADGIRHLLIPVPRSGDVLSDRRSRGVVVVPQELVVAGKEVWFADLVCVEERLADVFIRLAAAVCEAVTRDPETGGSAPARILDEWRELLGRRSTSMGGEVAVGLFGELTVLLHGVEAAGPSVFERWVGPEGHPQDFASDGVAIEVKATTARNGHKVDIHGIQQLSIPAESSLYLAFVRVLSDPGGERLSDLAAALEKKGVPALELRKRMKAAGFSEQGDDGYRFAVGESTLHQVGPTFPRITEESFVNGLPRGVESLRYVVDLTGSDPLSARDIADVFVRLADA
jgi:hypothetical protein